LEREVPLYLGNTQVLLCREYPVMTSKRFNLSVGGREMNIRSVKLALALLLVVCVGCVLPAWGQAVDTGTVVGTVTDSTGAVVVGATVTMTDIGTKTSRSVVTNDAGRYVVPSVEPGKYDITFAKQGFSTTKATGEQVTVGITLTVNIALKVGAASVEVEVTAVGNELQTMDATVGQTIAGNDLDALPGLGRDVSTFVTLQPGVAPDGSVGGANQDQNSFMLDGGNNSSDMDGTQNTYTASFASDPTGGLVNNEVTATAPGGSPGGGGPTGVMPTPADSIEEFRVGTNNQTADFNSSAGAQVKLVTKRGTTQWHGSAYEYYLDNNWAGNSYDNNFSGVSRPSYHYQRFGGSVGGPLPFKDLLGGKWFFFANYEGFRWPNSATTIRATPSADMRLGLLTNTATSTVYNLNPYPVTSAEGVPYAANAGCSTDTGFTSGVCDPLGIGVSPTMQQLWGGVTNAVTSTVYPLVMPMSNVGTKCLGLSRCDGVNVQAFTANYPVLWSDNFGVTRLDHDFGSKEHFYTTYRYYHQKRATANQIDIAGGTPVSEAARPSVPWYFTAALTSNISSNMTNDFHYSFLRNWWARGSLGDPIQVTGLGGALEPEGESSTNVLAPINLDTQDVRTRFWDGKDHMFRDDVSWLKGKHFFQFGGMYQHNWDYHQRTDNGGGINYQPVYRLGDAIGSTNGLDMTGFEPSTAPGSKWLREYAIALGIPGVTQIAYTRTGTNLQVNPPNTPAFDQSTIPFYNLYFNDSWHMKSTFTLTYGLGWTLEMPPVEAQGKQIAFVDANAKIIDAQQYLNTRASNALAGNTADINPEVGFTLIGNVAGHPKYMYNPFYKSFSPRIAAAWNPTPKMVVRGGYSILYGRLNGVDLVLVPLLGTGLIQAVQCLSPTASLGCAGAGLSTPGPGLNQAFRICPTGYNANCGGLVAPLPAASPTLAQPDFPGINEIAAGAGEGIDPNFRPSMNQQFDLTIQRQLSSKASIEIGYIGRHMTHEFQPVNMNAVPYMLTVGGQRFDAAYGQMVSQYCGLASGGMAGGNCAGNLSAVTPQPFFETAMAGTGYCTGFASCTQAVASRQASNIAIANVWSLFSSLDGGNAACQTTGPGAGTSSYGGPCGFNFSRVMMNSPVNCVTGSEIGCSGQLTSGVGMNTSFGYGNYNALFVSYKMSAWHGLSMQSNFTWAKALGTGSQTQATSEYSINDPFWYGRSYGYQPWDRKFMFNVWFNYTPTFYQGQHGLAGHLLGGWTIAPILDVGSGIPLQVSGAQWANSVYTGGQAFGGMDGGNISDYENAVNTCGGSFSSSRHDHFNSGGGFGANSPANLYADPSAVMNCFREPILGIDNGVNGGYGNFRGQAFWNVDLNIKKNLKITERIGAEFGALFTNVFNHSQLFDPSVNYLTDPQDFGSLESSSGGLQVDNSRKIEVDFRIKF